MEKEVIIETYGVVYICDKCEIGEMEQTGEWHMTNPPRYEHKCLKCGNKGYFKSKYPEVRYRMKK